jgi:hypothetical protein
MNTESGQNIRGALKAIARMHSDSSKLLIDCDTQIGKGRKSVFGEKVTRDLSYKVPTEFWMPEGVFRYYQAGPTLVDGVLITFLNAAASRISEYETEPLLKLARIQYKAPGSHNESDSTAGLNKICNVWDIWSLFFEKTRVKTLGQVLEYSDVDGGRISWARLISVPLFSIRRIEDVVGLMDRVVGAVPQNG